MNASAVATLVFLGMAASLSVYVIGQKKEPSVTLSWILAFFFLPYIGMMFFVMVGYRRYRRRRSLKPERLDARFPGERSGPPSEPARGAAVTQLEFAELEKLALHYTGFPPCEGNRITLFQQADATDQALLRAIRDARHHVHLEYYIFEPDEKGTLYAGVLREAAARGVECRLLVDAIGSFRLSERWLKPYREAGVQVAFFQPLRLHSPWGFHLRNHRKLAVIDGNTAFMGSQNVAHDVTTWRHRLISWRETNVSIRGPAVDHLQTVFAEDWKFASGKAIAGDDYFPRKHPAGDARVQFIPTTPETRENVFQMLFVTAVYAAHERVTVTTPYFIPTPAVVLALQIAARRGLNVEILVPRLSDQPLALYAGRSWYRELVESGVRIYENNQRFIHAKVVTIDDKAALLGSANMDNRSFLINFESSLLIYDAGVVRDLLYGFEESASQSKRIQPDALHRQPFARSLAEGAARILSPLL